MIPHSPKTFMKEKNVLLFCVMLMQLIKIYVFSVQSLHSENTLHYYLVLDDTIICP